MLPTGEKLRALNVQIYTSSRKYMPICGASRWFVSGSI
jgi:hypothetical protein